MEMNHMELETKVAGQGGADDALLRAFEAFKDANDERLRGIEKRQADVLSEEKVDRLSRQLDEFSLKAQRPQLSPRMAAAEPDEHRSAFYNYVRKGDAGPLIDAERKALSSGSSPDGGFLVPRETEAEISRLLRGGSPMRAISSVREISSSSYKKPFITSGVASGWVGETAARPETASPQMSELQFPAMEIYAMPAATQTLLDDSAVSIDQWIAEEVQATFAEQETEAFIKGDGVNRPKGFLTNTMVADAGWSWGKIGYSTTGAAGNFAGTNPADALVNLIYALKSGYRQNARFVLNRRTQSAIRRLKDAGGNYIWQPGMAPDSSATLMGFPVTEAEAMPDMAADSFALAFGDFQRGYLIVDRQGVRILRDPYSAKPYVLFYTTKRVGGGVQNFEAIKLLKFGTA